jgi:hypothetical protein
MRFIMLTVMSDAELLDFISDHKTLAAEGVAQLRKRHADLPEAEFQTWVGLNS